MGELDSKPNRTLEVIDSSNKIDVRQNFQKLDSVTLELIIKDLESESLSIAEMSRKYSCAKSKLYNIRKQKHYYLNWKVKRHFSKISSSETENLVKHINAYLNRHSFPVYVKDFQHEAEVKQSKAYYLHSIRNIMIRNTGMTYKRVSSRPLGYSSDIIKEARVLFCIKFFQDLISDTLILNIDEFTIGRRWREEYSLSKRSLNRERQNTFISGSLKFILVIASNGSWLALFTQSNINAK